MILRYAFLAGVVAVVGTTHVIAQQKPNFSGEWQLNREASQLSPTVAPVVKSGALRVEHHEPSVKCQMTIVMDGKPFETKFELMSDGREVTGTESGRQVVSRLGWDGDALVATWRVQGSKGEVTIAFRYELQDGGRRLQAAEQIRGGGRDQDNTWVFERP